MTFFESASLIGSQILTNWLVGINVEKGIASPSNASIFLAILGVIFITRGWTENPQVEFKDYKTSFFTHIFGGKSFLLLYVVPNLVFKNKYIVLLIFSGTVLQFLFKLDGCGVKCMESIVKCVGYV